MWQAGYALFKDDDNFPVKFVEGDIFKLTERINSPNEHQGSYSENGLTYLSGRVSVIYLSMVFHLFQEGKQRELAYRLSKLLSTEKGSVIFGAQVGSDKEGHRVNDLSFFHSLESWRRLWTDIFGEGVVKCDAKLVPIADSISTRNKVENYMNRWEVSYYIFWSVERL